MPGIDEVTLRDLMHRSTDDLHAPAAVTDGIIRHHRHRRLRNRALTVAVSGAAAGTAFAVVAPAAGHPADRPADGASASGPAGALQLTTAQTTLYQLSSAAAAAPARPQGRYVVLTERQDNYARTSVLDSLTGNVWTYQRGAGVAAELPVDRHGSPTAAEFDDMPTDPAALRALLIRQGQQQQAQATEAEQRGMASAGKKGSVSQPKLTGDDWAFEQATTLLWNPLVGPGLRSALYKVLADTPGVKVNAHARDAAGHPAVEISRYDSVTSVDDETFENPATGAVLETAFVYPRTGTTGIDLYQPVTSTNTLPANPYGS